MQRFNLVFAGQLLPGTDAARARRALAGFFGVADPAAIEVFFAGRPVPLRRNLSRDEAGRLYRQLRDLGLICELRPATAEGRKERPPAEATRPGNPSRTQAGGRRGETPRGAPPNLFALRPAIVSRREGGLREQLELRALMTVLLGLALVVVVITVSLRFPAAPTGAEPLGPRAAAAGPGGELIMLQSQALLLHRRSGLPDRRIDAQSLGVAELAPPLLVAADGTVIVGSASDGADAYGLLRCDLEARDCAVFDDELDLVAPPALAASYLGDALFLLTPAGRLLRRDAAGLLPATTDLAAREAPRLAYKDGLLLAPVADAPLVGVFRPDRAAFGAQIDALLLTPSDTGPGPAARVRDMALGEEARWAILEHERGAPALYRFDRQWGNARRIDVPLTSDSYLVPWRDRLLVADAGRATAARVAPDGRREADFSSELLAAELAEWRRVTRERRLWRRVGVIMPLAVATLALLYALLQASVIRGLAVSTVASTSLLDPMPGDVHWLPAAPRREREASRLGLGLVVLTLAPPFILFATGAWRPALCLLPVAAAALYARSALTRGLGGHLGFRGAQAVVIDHDGRYFYGPRSCLRRGAGFVFAPGVALPLRLPVLSNIVHVDHRTTEPVPGPFACLGLLWQLRHPWLLAPLALAVSGLVSLTAALLAG